MNTIDWLVLIVTTAAIILYGIWKVRHQQKNVSGYLLGDNQSKWWTIGLSVMATQASAITFLSTPGQAFADGMGFVQFYFGLPIAMVIICMIFIPRYFRMKVFTVYEFLEQRFDKRTRLFTAFLFLIQRGLGAGITIFAPSIILSTILHWDLNTTILIIGGIVTLYTAIGGTAAVSASHKAQMAVMMGGIILAMILTIYSLPDQIGFLDAIHIAGLNGKMNIVNFNFDLDNRYTFWSGITGGTFLALAYFGTDQSQAQRYISGQSIRESRLGLLANAALKIPMQLIILFAGVMVFVFYQFQQSPLIFNTHAESELLKSEQSATYGALQNEWNNIFEERKTLYDPFIHSSATESDKELLAANLQSEKNLRESSKELLEKHVPHVESNDKDYVFIRYILDFMPIGIIGLLLAAILAAGMSSSSSELNALASTTTIDFYKRLIKPEASEFHFMRASKWMTIAWGCIAILFARFCSLFENLIQFVNIVGSLFYGTLLGIFLSAFLIKRMTSNAVFWGGVVAQASILIIYWKTQLGFLWYNVIGCAIVVGVGLVITMLEKK